MSLRPNNPNEVLPPRVELGSRANLALPEYRSGALPIELQERHGLFANVVRPCGLEPPSQV